MAEHVMSDVLERFIRYCKIPTQSAHDPVDYVPSTKSQFDLAHEVARDLSELGALNVEVDEHAYVTAHWPASAGCEDLPTLGFCVHLDTSPDCNADPVNPHVVRYEGGKLVMGSYNGAEVFTTPDDNPQLKNMVGWDIVVTDGTSLLGGDDKAGIAEVVSLFKELKDNPQLPHPPLALCVVPDEEIGHGAGLLDLEKWGATWGYTIDGGPIGEISYECFNACSARLEARGLSVHPGTAKGIMINALEAIVRVHQLLPAQERPEYTENYDGFYMLSRLSGDIENASSEYIIRDHDRKIFEHRKLMMEKAVDLVNSQYGQEVVSLEFEESYRNMAEVVEDGNQHLIDNAITAFEQENYPVTILPMRGGTDGAQLSFRGLPCPNISACYYNAHGRCEFVPVPELEGMVRVLIRLVALYAQPQKASA